MLASNALMRRSISMLTMPLSTHWAQMSVPVSTAALNSRS